MKIDYYKVLGVARDATANEIKQAFRKLALECHPDRHAQESIQSQESAGRRFRQVSEAYDVLGDNLKRIAYNKGAYNVGNQGSGPSRRLSISFPSLIFLVLCLVYILMEAIAYSLYLLDMLICAKFRHGLFLFSSWMVEATVHVLLLAFVWLPLDTLFTFIDAGIVPFTQQLDQNLFGFFYRVERNTK